MEKITIIKLDKTKRYELACGHNNAGILNLWPFKTWVCLVCGFKIERIEEDYRKEAQC